MRNPLDPTRSAGGSSGGAAAALGEGMCFGALGTDTGGSIRIPSAACGTVGLKPTLGEISCDGVVPLSTTLDHVGPMARSVADVALMFERADRARPADALRPATTSALVFGVPRPYFCDRLDAGVRQALERAARRARSPPGTRSATSPIDARRVDAGRLPAHRAAGSVVVSRADCSSATPRRYSPGVRMRLEMGRYILAEDYVRAMRLRDVLTRQRRPRARGLRRAAAADAADRGAAARRGDGRRRRHDASRCARRCCG